MLSAKDIPFKHYKAADLLASKRHFQRVGEGRYELAWPDLGIHCTASSLHRGRDQDLLGELTVSTTLAGAKVIDGVLSAASFNFSSQQARAGRAQFLSERSGARDLDWTGALEMLCLLVIRAEAAGEPIKPLADYDLPDPETAWEILGIPLLQRHPMILFGDGAAGKSYLALYFAGTLAQRGIKVLYADWEFSSDAHRERLERLYGPTMPRDTLAYVRCVGPLVTEAGRLQAYITTHGIQYVVCDSIAFACPGRPEEAEHAAAYFRAVRTLGVGSLHLAHITKSQEHGEDKPFGSAFWSNGARSLWFAKRADDARDGESVEVALYHKKSNTGKKLPARGIRLSFGQARTTVERFEVTQNAELALKLPLRQRMRALVTSGAKSTDEIAEALEITPAVVRTSLARDRGLIRLADGRVGLAETKRDDSF